MRCPACNTDFSDGTACPRCPPTTAPPPSSGAKRKRRRDAAADSPDPAKTADYDRRVKRLIPWVATAMVPFLGLVLGPVSLVWVSCLLRRSRGDPAFLSRRGAQFLLVLAIMASVFHWLGLGVMWLGLRE